MGDYLKNAVERARGRTAPAIQPRIPSLFEPPTGPLSARFTRFAATPAVPEQQSSLAAQHLVEPARAQLPEMQPSLPTRPRAQREVLPPTELGHRDGVENQETRRTPTLRRPKRASIQTTVGGAEYHEKVVLPAVTARPARVLVKPTRTPETEPQTPFRVEPAPVKNPAPAPRPEIKPEVRATTLECQVGRSVVREVMERAWRVQTAQAPARPLSAAAGPVRHVPIFHEAGSSSSEPVEDSRPVINVVIGRVSVNAVTETPLTGAKPKQPAGPMLSLDRYLEQRRGQS